MNGKGRRQKKRGWLSGAVVAVFLSITSSFMAHSTTNEVEFAMVTDSDGDGLTDWQEWQARTNPGDSNSCLRITSAKVEGGKFILSWASVSHGVYEIVSAATIDGLATNAQRSHFVETSAGTGAWHETISTVTNEVGSDAQFFRIECPGGQSFEESVMDMATFE